jgi:alginate O-acetyltransferase complex protein AlgJ
MQTDRSRSPLIKTPVAAILALVLMVGFASGISLSARSVGLEALQLAGRDFKTPSRFLWFFRDRLNARFGAFTGLSAAWFWICWDVFGQSPTPKVVIGRNGWMFLRGDTTEDVRGLVPWTKGDKDGWLDRFDQWCEAAESRNIPLVIAVAPNKTSVVRRQLPIDDIAPFEVTRYGEFLKEHDEWPRRLQVAWLDIHAVIEACDPEASYFKTDSHWNYRGADCAAEAIAFRLGALGVERAEGHWEDSRHVTVDGGDLARMLGAATRFRERVAVPARASRIGSIEELQQLPPPSTLSGASATPRVLMIHDSFGVMLRDPLFARVPGCVYERGMPATMTGAELSSMLEDVNPDAVVIVFVERRLAEPP